MHSKHPSMVSKWWFLDSILISEKLSFSTFPVSGESPQMSERVVFESAYTFFFIYVQKFFLEKKLAIFSIFFFLYKKGQNQKFHTITYVHSNIIFHLKKSSKNIEKWRRNKSIRARITEDPETEKVEKLNFSEIKIDSIYRV